MHCGRGNRQLQRIPYMWPKALTSSARSGIPSCSLLWPEGPGTRSSQRPSPRRERSARSAAVKPRAGGVARRDQEAARAHLAPLPREPVHSAALRGAPPSAEELARARAFVAPFRAEVGLAGEPALSAPPAFRDQLAVVIEESVPVFSVTSGSLAPEDVQALLRRGTVIIGTATTPEEARALVAAGVQAVVVQSSEAAGHRATFASSPRRRSWG